MDFVFFLFLNDLQSQKDLQIKVDSVKRLMERGYRVKVISFLLFTSRVGIFFLPSMSEFYTLCCQTILESRFESVVLVLLGAPLLVNIGWPSCVPHTGEFCGNLSSLFSFGWMC